MATDKTGDQQQSGTSPKLIRKGPKFTDVYDPKGKEGDVLEHVYDRYYQMEDNRNDKGLPTQWDKWEKQWECYRPPKNADDWTSDIYIPITTSVIEAMMSEIVNQDLMPYAIERGAEDTAKAKVINAILQYTWDVSKSNVVTYDIIHDALVKGTGIGQEYYWKQEREIWTPSGKRKTVVDYDNTYLEQIPLDMFYIDEKAQGFFGPKAAEDCIRREVMDYDAFRTFFKGDIWDHLNNAQLVKPGGDVDYYSFYKPPSRMDHSREVEVLWYWNVPDDLLTVVANDVVVRFGPNPYMHKHLPFARATDVKRTNQFYGKGEAELMESLQEETNTLRRMIIDRNHLDIDKPILTDENFQIDDDDAIARPHGILPVGKDAKVLEYSDIASSVFKSLEMMTDDKIRVTGMDERQQSVSAAGTATEAAILKEATLKRLNMKIWQIKNDFLVDVGKLRVSNIMQFYSQPRLEEIIGEKHTSEYKQKVQEAMAKGELVKKDGKAYRAKYRNVRMKDTKLIINGAQIDQQPAKGFTFFEARPEYFIPSAGEYDIRFKASSTLPISKPLKQQKDMEMYDRLIQNPTVDQWKLAELLLNSGEYNADEYKMQQPGQQEKTGTQDLQTLVELAGIENSEMMNGKEIASTPYSSPVHTEIHINYMKSKPFKEDVPPESPIMDYFIRHIQGELDAQQQRAGGAGEAMNGAGGAVPGMEGPSPVQNPNAVNGQNVAMAAAMPGRIQGGGDVQTGMNGAQAPIAGPGRNL